MLKGTIAKGLFAVIVVVAGLFVATPAQAIGPPMTVVAVGDSYASGEGAIGSGWINPTCHRSSLAGPQLAAGLLSRRRPVAFTSLACSGATTASVISQLRSASMPSGPIDALTMSAGGNDIGFASIVTTCMLTSDCTFLDSSVTASLAALPGSLAGMFAAVPGTVANVFVTEYPDPTTGLLGALCGTSPSPAFHGLETISPAEAAWASARVVRGLNAALSAAVASANARPGPHPVFRFVSGISSRFATHGYCTGGGSPNLLAWLNPRYISTPADSVSSQGDASGTMHPNDLGQQQIGNALYSAMSFLTVGNIHVPYVIGDTAAEARKEIIAAGLSVRQTPIPDRSCNKVGTVVGQTPPAPELLWAGEEVVILIASRPPTPCP